MDRSRLEQAGAGKMAQWKLELKEDVYRKEMPYFHSIEERIAGYRQYYVESAQSVLSEVSREAAIQQVPDVHAMTSYFSYLLSFYGSSGREFTFSKAGWRTRERQLPSAGAFHRHEYIEILYVAEGSFSQILLGKTEHFTQGSFVITDSRIEHADYFTGEASVVLFLGIGKTFLNHLLAQFGQSGPLQAFFFKTIEQTQRVQRYVHLVPDKVPSYYQAELSCILEQLVREDELETSAAAAAFYQSGGGQTTGPSNAKAAKVKTTGPLKDHVTYPKPDTRIARTKIPGQPNNHDSPAATGQAAVHHREPSTRSSTPFPGRQQLLEGSLLRLLYILSLYYSMQLHVSDQESHDDILFYELDRYLHAHCSNVTIEELEQVFHYQRNYYNHLVQRYRQCSYMNYVQQLRMEKAARLLETTTLPVKEIAARCGYNNTSHFYHLFEEYFHCKPRDRRRSLEE